MPTRPSASVRKWSRCVANPREHDSESDPELILEDANSIREAMRRMVRYTSEATEGLDRRIEAGSLDGRTEAEELREALERVQALTLEVSEELDAYQQRHAR
jgi:flagellar biosynthesis/type III secretory pathway protein FliH